jgi:hypothetical protein
MIERAGTGAKFLLPAYDPTAMAMLGFGILAVLGLPFIF